MSPAYKFVTKLWIYPGEGAWYFITVPSEYAQEIKSFTHGWPNKGFGTIKVNATVKGTTWETSIFPDKKSGSYLMPIKKEIRSKLNIANGDDLETSITLRVI